MSRKEAEKLLLADENTRGTFLIRNSEHNPNGFSLSVKDWDENRGYHVKHYKIKPLDNGGYYIATNQTFATLPALVLAYTSMFINLKPTPIRLHSKFNLKICIFFFFFPPTQRMLWDSAMFCQDHAPNQNLKYGTCLLS